MPARGRPRNPCKERFWRQTLQRWQHSRLSAAQFCRRHQLNLAAFYHCKRILQLRDHELDQHPPDAPPESTPSTTTLPVFLPIQLPAQPSDQHAPQAIEVRFPNGVLLRLPTPTDQHALQFLLTILRGPSC